MSVIEFNEVVQKVIKDPVYKHISDIIAKMPTAKRKEFISLFGNNPGVAEAVDTMCRSQKQNRL